MGNNCISRKDPSFDKYNEEFKQSIYDQLKRLKHDRGSLTPKSISNFAQNFSDCFNPKKGDFECFEETKEQQKQLQASIIQSSKVLRVNYEDDQNEDHLQSIEDLNSLSFCLKKQMEEIIRINKSPLEQPGWLPILIDTKTDYMLKLYAKQIENGTSSKVNLTRSEFCVPCNPKQFIDFMNNIELQKSLDSRIEVFLSYDKNEGDKEFKIYLSYKGFFLVSPRDFVYAKKIKQIDLENNVWCDVSCSSEDFLYPPHPSKVRGEIISSGHLVQPLTFFNDSPEQSERFAKIKDPENWSLVRLYSHCDFKMNLPLTIAKQSIISEVRTFIEKIVKHFKDH